MVNTPNITIASGGLITANNMRISINTGGITNGNISTNNLRIVKLPDVKPLCNKRRGGPRSKVFCEVFADVPHEVHHGRGRSNWHRWVDRDLPSV